jgi:tRNA(Ile)-lysidine synthetase-like protein
MGKVCISLSQYSEADEMVRYGLLRKAHRALIASDRPHKSLDLELVENADRLMEQTVGTRADLNNRVMIERGDKHLILFLDDAIRLREEITIPGDNEIDGFCLDISATIEDIGNEPVEDADNYAVQIDFETTSAPYIVRTIEEGDRVRLLNAPGSRKLSDILADKKVPRSLRGEVPILTASGRIVWIVGIGIADDVKITDRTGKVLKLSARARVIQDGDEQER